MNEMKWVGCDMATSCQATVGKGVAAHSLPVIARGSIPSIYRRAAFPHRAVPGPSFPCGLLWPLTTLPRRRSSLERTLGLGSGSPGETYIRFVEDAWS